MHFVVVVAILTLSSSVLPVALARHSSYELYDTNTYEHPTRKNVFPPKCSGACFFKCHLRGEGEGKCVNNKCVCSGKKETILAIEESKKGPSKPSLCKLACPYICLLRASLGNCTGETCVCEP